MNSKTYITNMKYLDYNITKPNNDDYVVWLGPPNIQEIFGQYKNNMFVPTDNQYRKGFRPKWWRYATDIEISSFCQIITKPIKKRGRPKLLKK